MLNSACVGNMSQSTCVPFSKNCRTFNVCAATGCGKTVLMGNILREHNRLFEVKIESIVYSYNVYQQSFFELERDLGDKIHFIQGLASKEQLLSYSRPMIYIIDDLCEEAYNSQIVEQIFCVLAHHESIFCFLLGQNLYYKGSKSRTIQLNTVCTILLRNTRDKFQISRLARSMFSENYYVVLDAYKNCEENSPNGYFYLILDSSSSCPPPLRCRTKIFSHDSPVTVYLPKNGTYM